MGTLQKARELVKWFRDHGGHLHQQIEMLHNVEYGYHFAATKGPINATEILCRCPFGLTLSHLNVIPVAPTGIRNCSAESICSEMAGQPGLDETTIAIFFLIAQRLKGRESFWHPYIQLLPTEAEMTTPLWFKEEELVYLKGTNLLSNDTPFEKTSIGLQEAYYREQWELGLTVIRNSGHSTENLKWELFLWAATILSSRGFSSDMLATTTSMDHSFAILYPVLDVFNHYPSMKVEWRFSNGDFALSLEEKIQHGEQVFNNYSTKGNEDFLMGFGFCIPDNPYDQVAIRLGEVSTSTHRRLRNGVPSHWKSEVWSSQESVFYLRTDLTRNAGYKTSEVPESVYPHGIPPELIKSVNIILLTHNEALGPSSELASQGQLWAGTLDLLLQYIQNTLIGITGWNRELPNFPSTKGEQAALIYREGQIRILKEVIANLKAILDPLRVGEISIED